MKRIGEYTKQIAEELEGAKGYAEEYLYRKAMGETTLAAKYRDMANDELKHAIWIHDIAVGEIQQLNKTYTAPAEMLEAWEKTHREYVDRTAWIKQMLAM